MRIEFVATLAKVEATAWDHLVSDACPLVSHAYLAGLEVHRCLSSHGWHPTHALAYDGSRLVGALPLYLRDNSYGEFVFDWAWAEAFQKAGGRYYPKLVTAVPFTPSAGPRLLIDPTADNAEAEAIATHLIDAAIGLAAGNKLSSWHCLFPDSAQIPHFTRPDLILREGCQYHWYNQGYPSFDEFLGTLNSKRRKEIKRERRDVAAQNLIFEIVEGPDITAAHWATFYQFYCDTFDRKWGAPRLTEEFFNYLSGCPTALPVLFLARDADGYVAGAFAVRGKDALYGRHWGCNRYVKFLHFELCFYQTIDYCIQRGIRHLDAGAQGEHKIPRGFIAEKTWSVHWINDPGFRRAVAEFCHREQHQIERYIDAVDDHSAYREKDG